jgi:(4S)-4-hydroxy-5-phosphonooxypentane-2,3-dione isomerase
MHVVVEFLDIEPAHRVVARHAIVLYTRAALAKAMGCRQFDVAQDDVDGHSVLLYQIYESKAAHTAHLELPEYAEHRLLVDPWIRSRRILTYSLLSSASLA